MKRLKRIFFVRHGESEANVDLTVYKDKPDHEISLTELGFQQAEKTGVHLKQYIQSLACIDETGIPKTRMWVSPYLRTRQTAEALLKGGLADVIYDTREDTMLVEQQFGLFDGLTEEEQAEKYPELYASLQHQHQFQGKYWAKFPGGESPFDVDIRSKHMQGTFARDAERHDIENIIIVSHGITTRVMAMRYLHQQYEDYDAEKNPKNASVRMLEWEKSSPNMREKWVDKRYIITP